MSASAEPRNRVDLFGTRIDALTMDQTLDRLDDAIRAKRHTLVGVVNAAKMVSMQNNPDLRKSVQSADMILADGMAVVWASRLLGRPLPERVTGIDLMLRLFQRSRERGYGIYCLGATQEILDRFVERMRADHPGVRIVGAHHGYFQPADEPRLVEEIAASKADILFAAMSSPKKENFMEKWQSQMNVTVLHGVGGAFDVLAGLVRRAPESWQKLGLEWLYRLLQEPGRLWQRYLVTNSVFTWMVVKAFIRRMFGLHPPTAV